MESDSLSYVDQHARIQDAPRIERALDLGERVAEQRRPLAIVPGPVDPADRVVMGDRAAGGGDRLGRGGLERAPLRELAAGAERADERVVRRRAVGIEVREPAG